MKTRLGFVANSSCTSFIAFTHDKLPLQAGALSDAAKPVILQEHFGVHRWLSPGGKYDCVRLREITPELVAEARLVAAIVTKRCPDCLKVSADAQKPQLWLCGACRERRFDAARRFLPRPAPETKQQASPVALAANGDSLKRARTEEESGAEPLMLPQLPGPVLCHILEQIGQGMFEALVAASGVCRAWRAAVMSSDALWRTAAHRLCERFSSRPPPQLALPADAALTGVRTWRELLRAVHTETVLLYGDNLFGWSSPLGSALCDCALGRLSRDGLMYTKNRARRAARLVEVYAGGTTACGFLNDETHGGAGGRPLVAASGVCRAWRAAVMSSDALWRTAAHRLCKRFSSKPPPPLALPADAALTGVRTWRELLRAVHTETVLLYRDNLFGWSSPLRSALRDCALGRLMRIGPSMHHARRAARLVEVYAGGTAACGFLNDETHGGQGTTVDLMLNMIKLFLHTDIESYATS
eukprot:m51a1_g3942 hypothetical protein (471) ;mRNA; f:283212-285081